MEPSEWQGRVGETWAAEWMLTDRSLAGLQAILLDRVLGMGPAPSAILDIGCGAGTTSLALAEAYPDAAVIGVDLSEALISVAQQRPSSPRCRFVVADAAQWRPEDDAAPDLLVSRHGVMFFADPVPAFRNFHAISAAGARLAFSCFRDPAANPWATALFGAFADVPAPSPMPGVPGPFAFADAAQVRALLEQAGWRDVRHEAVDFVYVAGEGPSAVEDATYFFSRIGPAARQLAALEEPARAATRARMADILRNHLRGGAVSLDAAAWIWTARR